MPFIRDKISKQIGDRLHLLANMLKTRSSARQTDANHTLETVMLRFFNALYDWNLVSLNKERGDFPAVDLGDSKRRIAIQITNEASGNKITATATTAQRHRLGERFDRLIIFFLLSKKPGTPKKFRQPEGGPEIEGRDITDLLKEMLAMDDLPRLKRAAAVLEGEMGNNTDSALGAEYSLTSYLQALQQNFSRYENLGLPSPTSTEGEQDESPPIQRLFVEPTCTLAPVSSGEFDAALITNENPAMRLLPLLAEVENTSATARRTVLLADPGMGKSTLIQWLIVTLAMKESLPSGAESLRDSIPLPFILRSLVPHLPKDYKDWDWNALLNAFCRYNPRDSEGLGLATAIIRDEALFDTIINSPRAFFLIDGLDEIGDLNRRRALRTAIWEGFDKHRSARWLVTSRVVGYSDGAVDSREIRSKQELSTDSQLNFSAEVHFGEKGAMQKKLAQLLYLAPFDNSQQLAFAQNWYIPRLGQIPGEERAANFVLAVRQHPSVRVIGRVPNLLYLMALLYRRPARLPNGRALVYAAISEAYLDTIDIVRRVDKHHPTPYKLSEKVDILAAIARRIQEYYATDVYGRETGEILVTRHELETWLATQFSGDDGPAALHAFIQNITARSGLLLPRGENRFGFAHTSFQEYYVACWLESEFRRLLNAEALGTGGFLLSEMTPPSAGSFVRKDFAKLAHRSAWREPIWFLVEKLSAYSYDLITLISWLFPQLTSEPVPGGRNDQDELMPIDAARLLTMLSLDPQVALTLEQRRKVWVMLWCAHIEQQYGARTWRVAPTLTSSSEFEAEVLGSLVKCSSTSLDLSSCPDLKDLRPLVGLTKLRSLDLNRCVGVVNIEPLACLGQLVSLDLRFCFNMVDLRPLAELARLQRLYLSGCLSVSNLDPLAGLRELERLYLSGCLGLTDLQPLAGLSQLLTLDLSFCNSVVDLRPLFELTRLERLYIRSCENLSIAAVQSFKKHRPTTAVVSE